jgi:hypothetical protein
MTLEPSVTLIRTFIVHALLMMIVIYNCHVFIVQSTNEVLTLN